MNEYVLALDIGGTNIKAGRVTRAGEIIEETHCPSRAAEGRDALLAVLHDVVKRLIAEKPPCAVGVGSPGTVDFETGVIRYMQAHMPQWTGTPLAKIVSEWTGVPVVVDNDVNVIALGEYWQGAGRDARCMVSLAFGTGLGSGVVIDGKIFRGGGEAPELGHVVLRPQGELCTCGNFGCAEVYVAPGAMTRRAAQYLAEGAVSTLHNRDAVTMENIIACATEGDALCARIWDDAIVCSAHLLWHVHHIYDPDVIVLGGGLMKAGAAFLTPLREELGRYYVPPECHKSDPITVSRLGDHAGIVGAARLAWDALDTGKKK